MRQSSTFILLSVFMLLSFSQAFPADDAEAWFNNGKCCSHLADCGNCVRAAIKGGENDVTKKYEVKITCTKCKNDRVTDGTKIKPAVFDKKSDEWKGKIDLAAQCVVGTTPIPAPFPAHQAATMYMNGRTCTRLADCGNCIKANFNSGDNKQTKKYEVKITCTQCKNDKVVDTTKVKPAVFDNRNVVWSGKIDLASQCVDEKTPVKEVPSSSSIFRAGALLVVFFMTSLA